MNSDERTLHPTDLLSEYVDGELSPRRRSEVEAHVASCAECSRTADELRGIAERAMALADSGPERDLWPGIEARLTGAPARASRAIAPGGGGWARRFSFSLPQLAAAAFVLVLLGGGGTWLVLRGAADRAAGRGAPVAGGVESVEAAGGAVPRAGESLAGFDSARLEGAIAELEAVLAENRGRLDPATVTVVEENLALIDQAIEQARAAVRADPSSPYLNGHLAEQMKRKLNVLQRATSVATIEFAAAQS